MTQEGKQLRVTQVRSTISRVQRQRRTLEALGIRRMHQTVEHRDTPEIRGMLKVISHLIVVETVGT